MRRTLLITALILIGTTCLRAAELGERTKGNYDISFQPFAGGKRVERKNPGEIFRMEASSKDWLLSFERTDLPDALSLSDSRTGGMITAGYLTAAVEAVRGNDPTSEVLRSEILDMGKLRIGMIIATVKGQDDKRQLLQRAIVEITSRLYYVITMTSPAPEKNLDKDAGVKEAAETFRAIVDTIQQVDLSQIREDQDQRLFRTRALFVQWNAKKLNNVLEIEQFFRIRHEGKDVGYVQVLESNAKLLDIDQKRRTIDTVKADKKNPVDSENLTGLRVEMRMFTKMEDEKTSESDSSMFVTIDRAHEIWSNVVTNRNSAAKNPVEKEVKYSEVGSSDRLQERKFDKNLTATDFKEADKRGEIPYSIVETYTLKVSSEVNAAAAPDIEKQLPPFYLPQALGWLMPRLLPRDRESSYLFATYSSENRQIMLEYVDVGLEKEITLAGKKQRAIPISVRVGDEGSTTVHYVAPDGRYLGSNNPTTMLEISATNHETIRSIWKDADLSLKKASK